MLRDGAVDVRFGYARGLRSLQRAVGAALVVLVMAWPCAANAAIDTRVRLEYQADQESRCVSENEFRRMVTDQLGHDPFSPDADQRVAVSIAKTDAGFQGRIVGQTRADGRSVSGFSRRGATIVARLRRTSRSRSPFSCNSSSAAWRMTRTLGSRTPTTTAEDHRPNHSRASHSGAPESFSGIVRRSRAGNSGSARARRGRGSRGRRRHGTGRDDVRAPVFRRPLPAVVGRGRSRRGASGDAAGAGWHRCGRECDGFERGRVRPHIPRFGVHPRPDRPHPRAGRGCGRPEHVMGAVRRDRDASSV